MHIEVKHATGEKVKGKLSFWFIIYEWDIILLVVLDYIIK